MIRQLESLISALLLLMLALTTGEAHGQTIPTRIAESFSKSSPTIFDVRTYGAVGDGVAIDTETIQAAIDACHIEGGGQVRIPPGKFQIGTIELKSNVTLSLDRGATLLGSTNKVDYPTEGIDDPREGGPHCLIYANGASNIAIEGLGVIDGRGTPETSRGSDQEAETEGFVHGFCG